KIVNSAQYSLPQKVSNINSAISLIGLKGIKNLLYSLGTQNVLNKKYKNIEQLLAHASKTASFASYIAKEYKKYKILDDVYIGSMLHDIGKIILKNAHPGILEKIQEHCSNKEIDSHFIESITLGISHAKIGAEVSKKWNFPDMIVNQIEFHHTPLLAPVEYLEMASVTYLANELADYSADDKKQYASMEKAILEMYNLDTIEKFNALHERLNQLYHKQTEDSSG
ncbi:MAG: HDOD domain-containing protein, partial [Spirochaetota bacterium]